MKARRRVGIAHPPDGTILELLEHDGDFILTSGGSVLMSTRNRRSEEALSQLGCQDLGRDAHVLIGGLGMGFSLRAALDLLPDDARILQVELIPEIVEWNQGPLGDHAGQPCSDPRVEIVVRDVATVINQSTKRFDAILLDVDNGPSAMVTKDNACLYSRRGISAAHRALRPNGCLAIWSADDDQRLTSRLDAAGFSTTTHRVKGRVGGGTRHVVFVARRGHRG
ncbi:MAG: spermidine synthase [Planctomycetota bacterium]